MVATKPMSMGENSTRKKFTLLKRLRKSLIWQEYVWKTLTALFLTVLISAVCFNPTNLSVPYKDYGNTLDFRPKIIPHYSQSIVHSPAALSDEFVGSLSQLDLRNVVFIPNVRHIDQSIAPPTFTVQNGLPSSVVDFTPGSTRITLEISPANQKMNNGKPFKVKVLPGKSCIFGDKYACVYAFKHNSHSSIIFLTVHSGVGGDAQKFRHIIEGTGINRTGLKLSQIKSNMEKLEGSLVAISQSDQPPISSVIEHITRIPAKDIKQYFSLPVEETIGFASKIDPELDQVFQPGVLYIVLETCGWKLAGEPWAPGVSATTGSVYLSVISIP